MILTVTDSIHHNYMLLACLFQLKQTANLQLTLSELV